MNPRLVPPARLARSVLRTQSDERLCDLARAGSEAAFEVLIGRYRRDLVRHCARLVGDSDAEEAVQEALVRAHQALARGAEVERAPAWLHVIAHNVSLNLLRSRAGRPGPLLGAGELEIAHEDGAAQRRMDLDELVAAVEALPSRQRDAIVMRELEGRSYVEIADRLGATPGAVRQLLNRARTSVRARLTGLLPWNLVYRWGVYAPAGGPGARLGTLAESCAGAVKVCVALLPAAALGAGGLTLAEHGPSRHHPGATAARTLLIASQRGAVTATGSVAANASGALSVRGVPTAAVATAFRATALRRTGSSTTPVAATGIGSGTRAGTGTGTGTGTGAGAGTSTGTGTGSRLNRSPATGSSGTSSSRTVSSPSGTGAAGTGSPAGSSAGTGPTGSGADGGTAGTGGQPPASAAGTNRSAPGSAGPGGGAQSATGTNGTGSSGAGSSGVTMMAALCPTGSTTPTASNPRSAPTTSPAASSGAANPQPTSWQ